MKWSSTDTAVIGGPVNTLKNKFIDACIIITTTLVIFTALEITARILRLVRDIVVTSRADAIILKQPWGKRYTADGLGQPTEQYRTYVEFRESPYMSTTINVDKEGKRRVPKSCEKEDAFTIFMFGGSTMFGSGVPDEFTIPAYVAESFNQGDRCVRVVNYGAGWWQSSQSLIQLLETLKKGARPHAVVFYEGINDINVVTFGGPAGGIAPEVDLLLKQAYASSSDQDNMIKKIAQSSVFVRSLRTRLFPALAKSQENTYAIPKAQMPELVNAIVRVYANNVRTVGALEKEYGFTAYFFLQPFPLIAGKKNTDLEDLELRERTKDREWEPDFIRMCYAAIRENSYLKQHTRYYDISRIFDGLTEELYLDTEHLLPNGNKIIAERIAQEINLSSP